MTSIHGNVLGYISISFEFMHGRSLNSVHIEKARRLVIRNNTNED